METFPPSAFMFNATLAAPPMRCSFFLSATMGTGASGEILSTLPHQYVSSITSPITPAFNSLKRLNNLLKSGFAISFTAALFLFAAQYNTKECPQAQWPIPTENMLGTSTQHRCRKLLQG